MRTNIIQELYNRGLIKKLTDEINLKKTVQEKKIHIYCGFDPTAESLHIGHLIPLLCLKHFYLNGHIPIVVIGGATALIGDPSFKEKNANFLHKETVYNWTQKIEKQIKSFILCKKNLTSLNILNNYSWLKNLTILDFLRKFGIYCSVNKLLNKESIKMRLRKKAHLSFMTFSYSFLQGYDYCFLNKKYNVILQIGGSDQWGNITLGIDLVNHVNKKTVYGLTTPLMVRSNGTKLGKSDNCKSIIWLDKNKTSVYDFYQFWLNSSDEDVFKFLKMFTFLKISDISKLEKKFIHKKIKPFVIQKILAQEITHIVHGKKQLNLAKKATSILFHKDVLKISEKDFILLSISGVRIYKVFKKNIDIKSILVNSGLSKSKKNAQNIILSSSVSINNSKNVPENYIFKNSDKLYDKYTILKKGKKNFCLLIWMHAF
ncbi:tyrosyl-tRNA synthetase [Wigglesworthia glossinidia endosymbiont of Glossina morsitans morsitans (Yale colony)]|uniref:Tyrosine--tRNA ligase n=1 Tax=Wigglesworthia glossinidia endosymbiont of Glossina morsitans morsitans (Yale colony) TaxID=1142511 RepID=H6Q4X7_WIGGL|nr:tyrosine--tRNA ligase [Wigglesworthia glossinidia]AFA41260.1 tyrosyl-tRNA synthetase [Wigglesworthia glossinidia endosymbiont of Glossina morsitans morsitans (Yale colony)]